MYSNRIIVIIRTPKHIHLNKVLCGHGRMGALAIRHKIRNDNAAIVVRADSTDKRITDLSTDALESTSSASVDNQIRLGLVNGVERSQGSYWRCK